MVVYALEPIDPYSISSTDGQVSDDDVPGLGASSLRMYQGVCVACAWHLDQTRDSATAPVPCLAS
eukprot:scaffold51563_cov63-Phaeocystis_antarctica.AAC.1